VHLIYGLNESGKSTLLEFIRRVLFGFRISKGADNLYPPLAGGRHGGWIEVEMRSGQRHRLERYDAGSRRETVRISGAGRQGADGDAWQKLLGPVTPELFNSVYAFGLGELQSFESLNKQSISELIYGAGLGLGQISLTKVEKQLSEEAKQLFAPRGKTLKINDLLNKLHETKRRIGVLKESLESYGSQRAELQKKRDDIRRLEQEKSSRESRLRRLENLLKAHEPFLAMRDAQSELDKLPEVDSFPADGLTRLEALRTSIAERQNAIRQKKAQKQELEERIRRTNVDTELLSYEATLRSLQRELGTYEHRQENLPHLRAQAETLEQAIDNEIASLGPDWDKERVRTFDRSMGARDQIASFEGKLAEAERKVSQAESEFAARRRQLEEATTDLERRAKAHNELPRPSVSDHGHWQQRKEWLLHLRERLDARREAERKVSELRTRLQSLEEGAEEVIAQPAISIPSPVAFWVTLAAGFVLLAFSLLPRGFHPERLLFAIALFLGSFFFRRWVANVERQWTNWRTALDARAKRRNRAKEEAKLELQTAEGELRQCQDSVISLATRLNLPAEVQLSEVEPALREVETALKQLDELRHSAAALEEAAQKESAARQFLERAEADLQQQKEILEAIREEWRHWLRERHLSPQLSPTMTREVLAKIDSLVAEMRRLAELQLQVRESEKNVTEFEWRVRELLAELHRPVPETVDARLVQELVQELEHAQEAAIRKQKDEEELEKLEASLAAENSDLGAKESELKALLEKAGAISPDDFIQRSDIFSRRNKLREEISANRRQIILLVGEPALEQTEQELTNLQPEKVEQEIDHLMSEIQNLENEIKQLTIEVHDLEKEIGELEKNEEVTQLLASKQQLLAELEVQAEEWMVLVLARHLLERTREHYEQTRQPAVYQRASEYFARITGNRYSRVVFRLGETEAKVETATGEERSLMQLSRGTQEQLYLCLRFGLIEAREESLEPLPVIMDDILVNFDPERARATTRELLKFARDRQVIFLTCHEHIVRLFHELDPSLGVHSLRR